MRILKPLRIGYMNKIAANADGKGRQVVVTGQICWDLLAPQTLYTDQKLWAMVRSEFTGTSFVLDHWTPKVRGEFLACGKAVKPGGASSDAMQVCASVGTLNKRLSVSGDRFWRPGLLRTTITEPAPFSEMPIVYERAFGGKDSSGKEFSANPVGCGYGSQNRVDEGDLDVQLPNFEYPDRPVLHQDDMPVPAAFGPADMGWAANVAKLGTYDKTWVKWRSPLPPLDYSPSAYNVAPPDQQLPKGFFTGNEEVVIEGMHAEHTRIVSRLPGLAMRVFTAREGQAGLFESPVQLDTVWLFPSALNGVLLYRAVIDCEDADARDISAVMMACEYLGQPRSLAHYEEVYRLRTDEATKAHYMLADDQLMPALTPEAERELEEKREQVRQARRDKWHAEGLNFKEMTAALTGVAVPSVTADYMTSGKGAWLGKLLPVGLPEDIARGNVDLAGIHRSVDKLKNRMDDTRAAASRLLPANRRADFGFSEAESARGASFTKEEASELLNLGEQEAAMAGISADLSALVDRLEADPTLSISAEVSKFGAKMSDASFNDFIGNVRD